MSFLSKLLSPKAIRLFQGTRCIYTQKRAKNTRSNSRIFFNKIIVIIRPRSPRNVRFDAAAPLFNQLFCRIRLIEKIAGIYKRHVQKWGLPFIPRNAHTSTADIPDVGLFCIKFNSTIIRKSRRRINMIRRPLQRSAERFSGRACARGPGPPPTPPEGGSL